MKKPYTNSARTILAYPLDALEFKAFADRIPDFAVVTAAIHYGDPQRVEFKAKWD